MASMQRSSAPPGLPRRALPSSSTATTWSLSFCASAIIALRRSISWSMVMPDAPRPLAVDPRTTISVL